jgi:hypothetical protein
VNLPFGIEDEMELDPLPQQAMVPTLRAAQPIPSPIEIAVKAPAGGAPCPRASSPQQEIVREVEIAQALSKPLATCSNWPDGGPDCPTVLSPKQERVPSSTTPQVFVDPADSSTKLTFLGGVVLPSVDSPQQVATPVEDSPQACACPRVIDSKVAEGAVVCALSLRPQQDVFAVESDAQLK